MKLKIAGMLILIILLFAVGGNIAFAADPDPGLNVDVIVVGDNPDTTVTVNGDNPQTAVGIGGDSSKTNVVVTGAQSSVSVNGVNIPVVTMVIGAAVIPVPDWQLARKEIMGILDQFQGDMRTELAPVLTKLNGDLSVTIDGVANLILISEKQRGFNTQVVGDLRTLQAVLNDLHGSLTDESKLTQDQVDKLNELLAALAVQANNQIAFLEKSLVDLKSATASELTDLQNADADLQ
ncbi:MAG: hypothetical protein Q7T57_00115, partial [Dehalococcoidales bacterium]|nr:hypothetical protein [Dehalococcoidales bacterium]